MKKRSEATQTLRAGCSKADPQTNTYIQRDRGDYNTLHSLARSVIMSALSTSFVYSVIIKIIVFILELEWVLSFAESEITVFYHYSVSFNIRR